MREACLVRALLIAISLIPADLLADAAWTIPGIVNAAGLNGTHFVSDLTVTNPGAVAANVTLSFFPSGAGAKALVLSPGQTVVSSDVVAGLFGLAGASGAISVVSDQPLLIRAKTYNTASSGTYGVALPVVTTDRLFAAGDAADSLWVSQDPSPAAGYRTNVALVFPDDTGGEATVTVFDADGNERGSKNFSLDTAGVQQFSVAGFAGAVPVGRAQVAVTRGHAAGYAVVVDNVTGDSSLFAFADLPGGIQDVVANGVARANGKNGAFFRTDGRFYNPTDTDATVQVAFHASGSANPSPATASFVLPAGKIRDVVDILDSLLALPVGSSGALRFRSEWPVAILCRTSNVDPSGAQPGTFGAQQKPVPLLSFVTSADAGAAITGIRQDAAFRTNVGFAAGADGAQYALTLTDAAGNVAATTTASLGAFGWTQPGIQALFPGTTIPENATLRLKVMDGSVDVFDSSVDNLSGDAVVTPIAPLPADIPSSATIGPAGGSIRSSDGRLTLRIPAGALASNVAASIETSATNGAPQGSGAGYLISPGDVTFGKPATLVFRYDRSDLEGSGSGALGLAFESGGLWFVATGGAVSAAERTLTVPITSTAPATGAASSSPRPLAAPSPAFWAPFRSFVLKRSSGGGPLFTGKQDVLAVYNTGSSSSGSSRRGSSPLSEPVQDRDLHYLWFVNGVPLGDNTVGTIDDALAFAGLYTAPRCSPPGNPVSVAVKLSSPITLSPSVAVWLVSNIRIVSRDWRLTIGPTLTLNCVPARKNSSRTWSPGPRG